MRMRTPLLLCLTLVLAGASPAPAIVRMDEGRRQVRGIQLLQDHGDPTAYYYIPSAPRLATDAQGNFQLLCLKYQGKNAETTGGLFHALVEFTLPPEEVAELEKELRKQVPGARIAGPVPLLHNREGEGSTAPAGFEIVSAVLKSGGETPTFARSVVTSGRAPITPGSRAAVAALLTQEGATLLWDSLTGPTSDVSVSVNASYEALVTAFDARVTADVSTVYRHFSSLKNFQEGAKRDQVRNVVDELRRSGTIRVEALDRSKALEIPGASLQGLLDTITSRITEMMFDTKTGASADPPREEAVEKGQIAGRQSRGFLTRLFAGSGNQPYYSDNQFVLKKREDIRQNTFSVILTRNATVRVPVHATGNLRGLYEQLKDNNRYFKTVSLETDAAFQRRLFHITVDGALADGFKDVINSVAVTIRKKYEDNPDFTRSIRISQETLKEGRLTQEVSYPLLGETGPGSQEYEYRVVWDFQDRAPVRIPAEPDAWEKTSDSSLKLEAPVGRHEITLDADRGLFNDAGIAVAHVALEYPLLGKPAHSRLLLRANDTSSASTVTLFKDPGAPVRGTVTWYYKNGKQVRTELPTLDRGSDREFHFLVPPKEGTP